MSLFSRFKKDSSSSVAPVTTGASEQFQTDPGTAERLMEELYKRNAELAVRNKTMALLRRLDEISLKVIEEGDMAKEMTSAISEEFGYDLAALFIADFGTSQLRWLSIASATPWIADAIKQIDLLELKVPIAENQELMKRIGAETSYLSQDQNELYPEALVKALAEVAGFYKTEPMKNSLVNALRFGDQLLGVLILSSARSLKDLSSYEHESIVGIVGLISLALYKAGIYKQLQDLTHNLQNKVDEQTKEIKVAYEVEKKARLDLEELDKEKDQFILTTQHHLRTPLTIVKGYVETVLSGKNGKLNQEIEDSLKKAFAAVERLAKLMNEFLDISQLEVGKGIINKTTTNIKDLTADVLSELHEEIKNRQITVNMNFGNDSNVSLDKERFRDALVNIVDNGLKYNKPNGSITITGEKFVHPIERDKKIFRLTIEDTGIGIPKDDFPKLFTQYFERGKEAQKVYTTGRGLGLVLARNIIQAHQGKIWAESDGENKGSKFIIELPA